MAWSQGDFAFLLYSFVLVSFNALSYPSRDESFRFLIYEEAIGTHAPATQADFECIQSTWHSISQLKSPVWPANRGRVQILKGG
jgi:hypothetical protein